MGGRVPRNRGYGPHVRVRLPDCQGDVGVHFGCVARVGYEGRLAQVIGTICCIVASVTLMETGMTSISSIMLRDRIQYEFPEIEGMDLTFVFDYPTVREMSAFILDALPEDYS